MKTTFALGLLALGLLSLVSARFILTLYPMSPDEKARKGQTRS